MSAIDKLLEAVDNELKKIDVDGVPFPIYYRPMTLIDQEWIEKQARGSQPKFVMFTVIRKCLDENGNKMFTLNDKNKLLRSIPSELLSDIVIKMGMGESDDDDPEDDPEKE